MVKKAKANVFNVFYVPHEQTAARYIKCVVWWMKTVFNCCWKCVFIYEFWNFMIQNWKVKLQIRIQLETSVFSANFFLLFFQNNQHLHNNCTACKHQQQAKEAIHGNVYISTWTHHVKKTQKKANKQILTKPKHWHQHYCHQICLKVILSNTVSDSQIHNVTKYLTHC